MTRLESVTPPAYRADVEQFRADAGSGHVPLRVTIYLANAIGGEPVHLDNLLASLCVNALARLPSLPRLAGAYDFPLPLRVLWRDADGLPLYAATPLTPRDTAAVSTAAFHRRLPLGRWSRPRRGERLLIDKRTGRWKESRLFAQLTLCPRVVGYCEGNAEMIAWLLDHADNIGKKRAHGHGNIARIDVDPADVFPLVDNAGRLTRELPRDALHLLDGARITAPSWPLGWTPAQWNHHLWRDGWPVGTAIE